MLTDATILRLIISQAFAVYFLLILIPLEEPQKRNTMIIILGALSITLMNALLIIHFGLPFYIRFYFLTLTLPYIALFLFLTVYKGAKFIFALLSVQVIANVAIINGLLASYIFYGQNTPFVDTIARIITYVIFLPIVTKFIRPTYLKMAKTLNKGWWVLNAALILSYALAYYILFIPDAIFYRPEYFIHAYLGIILSLLIYIIIFFLFLEIQSKMAIERDKKQLSTQITSLAAESAAITTIAYKDALTGVKNRYSLFKKMDQLVQNKQRFYVIFIDLDKLKEINDTHGHTKGDTYLKQIAIAIQSTVKDKGEVYRFAGDEFVCIMMDDYTEFNRDLFKEDIAKNISIDIAFHGISLGLASYPEDGLDSGDLISLADQQMYTEKKAKSHHR